MFIILARGISRRSSRRAIENATFSFEASVLPTMVIRMTLVRDMQIPGKPHRIVTSMSFMVLVLSLRPERLDGKLVFQTRNASFGCAAHRQTSTARHCHEPLCSRHHDHRRAGEATKPYPRRTRL